MSEMHEHGGHSHHSGGSIQGNPKTMFFLGLFAGIAACTTVALIFLIWSIASGKGLNLGSSNNGQAQQVVQQPTQPTQPTAPQAPSQPVKPVDEKTDHIIGAKDAKVTIIQYSDFECPFCKRHFSTMNDVMKAYPNDVRMVFRHYPLSFHQNAMKEAEASECIAELKGNDAFWKFHDKIFTETQSNGTGISLERLPQIAKEIGVDEKKFNDCLNSDKYQEKINQQMAEGAAAGVQGTPGSFVNGVLVEGAQPLAAFKAAIDAALKK
ncbi:DsbA family protein [Candidatus Uhrbacteria bacterium]|nr:DsbA family protein [Candidatus Uhrbacteria bacterium]